MYRSSSVAILINKQSKSIINEVVLDTQAAAGHVTLCHTRLTSQNYNVRMSELKMKYIKKEELVG